MSGLPLTYVCALPLYYIQKYTQLYRSLGSVPNGMNTMSISKYYRGNSTTSYKSSLTLTTEAKTDGTFGSSVSQEKFYFSKAKG